MEQYQINKTTYLIHRIFSGNKTASQLVGDHLKEVSCQVLPLTDTLPISYNMDGSQFVVRSSE